MGVANPHTYLGIIYNWKIPPKVLHERTFDFCLSENQTNSINVNLVDKFRWGRIESINFVDLISYDWIYPSFICQYNSKWIWLYYFRFVLQNRILHLIERLTNTILF